MGFSLGQTVKIKSNGKQALIVGIWSSLNGGTDYRVRYTDDHGRLDEVWLSGTEFE